MQSTTVQLLVLIVHITGWPHAASLFISLTCSGIFAFSSTFSYYFSVFCHAFWNSWSILSFQFSIFHQLLAAVSFLYWFVSGFLYLSLFLFKKPLPTYLKEELHIRSFNFFSNILVIWPLDTLVLYSFNIVWVSFFSFRNLFQETYVFNVLEHHIRISVLKLVFAFTNH